MTATLLHGNCFDVLPTLIDASFDMVFADLPYGVTANKWDTPIDLDKLWEQLLRVGKPKCAFIFTATQPFVTTLINSQPKLFRYDLVWDKCSPTGHLNANRQPLRRHESVLLFCRKASHYNPQKEQGKPYSVGVRRPNSNYGKVHLETEGRKYDGARYPTSIVSLSCGVRHSMTHPTQKPVALLEWLIKTYTNEGDTVLDPTSGSGTTAVAALRTGRHAICIEQYATYHATAQERIAKELIDARDR